MRKEKGFAELEDARLHYRIDGPAGAPWLVFSNSVLTDLHVWDRQAEALGESYRLLRYDQRGHGRSTVPEGPVTIDHLGADLAGLLDRFAIDRCTLVGLSIGVPTVLAAWARVPDRVRRLVLVDGQAATAPEGAAGWTRRIEEAETNGMKAAAAAAARRWFGEAFRAAGRHLPTEETAAATPLAGFRACAKALQDYDYASTLAEIRIPTLVVAGADDAALMPSVERLAAGIAFARLERIPGAGHLPNVERADEFNRVLLDFLERTAAQTAA